MFKIVLIVLLIWSIAGFLWFFKNLGNKNKPDPWYAGVLMAPVMLIIVVFTAPRDFKHWLNRSWPYGRRVGRGRVDKVELTWGAGGNQYTTINGVKYATYWDFRSKDWEVGQVVDFEFYWDDLHLGANEYDRVVHADKIKAANNHSDIWT